MLQVILMSLGFSMLFAFMLSVTIVGFLPPSKSSLESLGAPGEDDPGLSGRKQRCPG